MERCNLNKSTLTILQRQKRLDFAFKYSQIDWHRVIFSDEATLGPVRIWASMNQYGPFQLRILDGDLTSSRYVSILQDILPVMKTEEIIFMQGATYAIPNVKTVQVTRPGYTTYINSAVTKAHVTNHQVAGPTIVKPVIAPVVNKVLAPVAHAPVAYGHGDLGYGHGDLGYGHAGLGYGHGGLY